MPILTNVTIVAETQDDPNSPGRRFESPLPVDRVVAHFMNGPNQMGFDDFKTLPFDADFNDNSRPHVRITYVVRDDNTDFYMEVRLKRLSV